MKTNEIYTATLMDLREVDCRVFTDYNAKDIQAQINNPESQLSSLLEKATKEINEWTARSLPNFYKKLDEQEFLEVYPRYVMLIVQSMQLGEIQRARYNDFKNFFDRVTSDLTEAFFEDHSKFYDAEPKPANTFDAETERDLYWNSRWNKPSNLHELQFIVKKVSGLKAVYSNGRGDKWFQPVIDFYQEWDVFAQVNKELKKIVVATKKVLKEKPVEELYTCAACFCKYRMKNKTSELIAYHGFYREEGDGVILDQTCTGGNFVPFEVSCDGTIDRLNHLVHEAHFARKRLISTKETLEQRKVDKDCKPGVIDRIEGAIYILECELSTVFPRIQKKCYEEITKHYPNRADEAIKLIRESKLEASYLPKEKPLKDIERIGKTLYGEVWVAQLTRKLKNEQGNPLPQSTLKSMRDRNTFPMYIQKQLPAIYEERLAELKAIESLIYPDSQKEEV